MATTKKPTKTTVKKPIAKKPETKKPVNPPKSTKEILHEGVGLTKDVTKKVVVESKEFIQKHDLVNKTKHAAGKTVVVSEGIIKKGFRKIKNVFKKKRPVDQDKEKS